MGNTNKKIQSHNGWVTCPKCKGKAFFKGKNLFVCNCGHTVQYPENLKLIQCQDCGIMMPRKFRTALRCSKCKAKYKKKYHHERFKRLKGKVGNENNLS